MSAKKHVMIVEDNPLTSLVISTGLKKLDGFVVHSFEDGVSAWQALQPQTKPSGKDFVTFDLIISDWQLPGMTGLELLKKVRTGETNQDVPFILLTGKKSISDVQEATSAGATECLFKPINVVTLGQKIASILAERDPSFPWEALASGDHKK